LERSVSLAPYLVLRDDFFDLCTFFENFLFQLENNVETRIALSSAGTLRVSYMPVHAVYPQGLGLYGHIRKAKLTEGKFFPLLCNAFGERERFPSERFANANASLQGFQIAHI
jgi:hypothetical protein